MLPVLTHYFLTLRSPDPGSTGICSPASGVPAPPSQPQLRTGVPVGSTRRKPSTALSLGLTTTGWLAACSSGRSARLSLSAIAISPEPAAWIIRILFAVWPCWAVLKPPRNGLPRLARESVGAGKGGSVRFKPEG